jgi:hypothetical protein
MTYKLNKYLLIDFIIGLVIGGLVCYVILSNQMYYLTYKNSELSSKNLELCNLVNNQTDTLNKCSSIIGDIVGHPLPEISHLPCS